MTKEYVLTQSNVWKILGQTGLEDATQQEADENQFILEATLTEENLTFAEVSISEVRFTHDDNQVRGIINCMKNEEFLQIRI
jgi:hypothetical protein